MNNSLCFLFVSLLAVMSAVTQPTIAATFDLDDLFGDGTLQDESSSLPLSASLSPALRTELLEARDALLNGRTEAASILARNITETVPEAPEGWHVLGLALAGSGDTDAAIEALDRASELYVDNAEPLIIKGEILSSLGKQSEAAATFLAAIARDPTDYRAHEKYARELETRGDLVKANMHYRSALQLAPLDHLFPRLRLAKIAIDTNVPESGLPYIEEYLQHRPNDLRAVAGLAQLQLAAGMNTEAAQSYARAIALSEKLPALWVFRATALTRAGELDQALATLDEAILRHPQSAEIAFERAKTYGAAQDYEQALSSFQNADGRFPEDIRFSRGARLAAYRLDKRDVALDYAQKAASAQSASSQDHFWLGLLHEQGGESVEAAAAYETAIALDPSNWIAANNLAVLLTPTNPARAVELALRAEAIQPESTDVQATLGWAQYHNGNLVTAREVYQNLAALPEAKPHHIYRLGVIALEQGNETEGRSLLRTALALENDFEGAEDARARLGD